MFSKTQTIKKSFLIFLHDGSRRVRLAILCCGIGILSVILAVFVIYRNYRENLISKEQQVLLTMAETIGHALSTYVGSELEGIDLFCASLEDQAEVLPEDMASIFEGEKSDLYDGMLVYDSSGCVILENGFIECTAYPEEMSSRAVIFDKILSTRGWYQLFITRDLVLSGEDFKVVYAMNLSRIYESIVHPVRIGNGGYSVVKDGDLAIIMHHASNQLGMDAIYDRRESYPTLDLDSLFQWLELQQREPSGTGVIESYRWDDPDLSEQKRIVAYTSVQLPGDTWIVNSTLPYEEIGAPLHRMILMLVFLCIVLLTLIALIAGILIRSTVIADGQKKEIKYLKRINEGMELLHRKDEELNHLQRVQTLGQMSSHIAHEFNNYLTPVILCGELLESDDTIEGENRQLLDRILASAEQASQLSRRLLDFSRQESNVLLKPVNLTEEVRKAVEIVRTLTPRGIEFRENIDDRDFLIMAPDNIGSHLLMNLCNNAFHAMEKEGGVLSVTYTTQASGSVTEENPGWAELRIEDTGCGIPEDVMDRIFEPFYTTKRSGKGTGLGLSAVKSIVTTSCGRLNVESEVGKGTTFRLAFPETRTTEEAKKTQSCERIAVVDDDPEVLASLTSFLRKTPQKKSFYNHSAVLISKLQKNPDAFDLVLTDYAMPSVNGVELAEIAKSLSPGIRVILMSGGDDENLRWYLKNGIIDEFLLKTELHEKLLNLL